MAYNTTWTVTTYDSADNIQPGHWYSVRNKKEDGMCLGTVMTIFRDKQGNWGDLSGSLASRFPGWIVCEGDTLQVEDYPDLWEVIGNTYGGDGAKTVNGNTKTYSGSFNLPDYRNRRLHGTGPVDGNQASSPTLVTYQGPDSNSPATGDAFTAGSQGGNWYIGKIDAQGDPPDEQVYSGTGQSDSKFFKLGTLVTTGADGITGDTNYNIVGNIQADIGPVKDLIVNVPQHEHIVISGQADQVPVGWVPWALLLLVVHFMVSIQEKKVTQLILLSVIILLLLLVVNGTEHSITIGQVHCRIAFLVFLRVELGLLVFSAIMLMQT